MSFLGKLFGSGKSSEKTPSTAEAIQQLFETEEILNKKQSYLEKQVDEQIEVIKKNGTANKRVSLAALKKKKRLEKQLEQIDGTLTTLEFQKEALENAGTNAEVMKVMKTAASAMKAAHNNMNIDQVEDLMDDVREQQDVANEISQAISNPMGFGTDVDEDELMSELELMEQEELNLKMLDTGGSTSKLPDVPTASLETASAAKTKKQQEEEDELRELAQWAS